jgi:hypothetical protein
VSGEVPKRKTDQIRIHRNEAGQAIVTVPLLVGVLGLVLTLVTSIIAGTWVVSSKIDGVRSDAAHTYAPKEDIEELKVEQREMRQDIKTLLTKVERALAKDH